YFHHFSNRNFHENVLYQYHHLFYFHALFDDEIELRSSRDISFSAFERLHNSCIDHSFLHVKNVRHFRIFRTLLPCKVYHTILYIHKVCALRGFLGVAESSTSRTKRLRPFFFFQRKKKQKNLTSATSAKWNLSRASVWKFARSGSIFSKKPLEKISTLSPCKLPFCPIVFPYRKPYSAKIKFYRLSVF